MQISPSPLRTCLRRGAAALAFLLLASLALAQPRGKMPVPAFAEQQKSRDLVADVLADDFAKATDGASKLKLAATLLQQSREAKDDPTLR